VGERVPSTAQKMPAEPDTSLWSSPRPQVSSGPCLFAANQAPKEDPSLLSFAEKTHMFNARSHSHGDTRRALRPNGQMVAPSRPATLGAPRIGMQAGGGLNGFDPKGFTFVPNNRNTIPMAKPCVQPPAPASVPRSAAATPQQLTPPNGSPPGQMPGVLHSRGRSSSPYHAGGQYLARPTEPMTGYAQGTYMRQQPMMVLRR
ncbi:unnamed protein product, partial [Effrenium voratum]